MESVRYPSYRDSGLPWVPEIPEGWQVLRNGRLFAHRVQTGFPDLPILEVSLRTGVRVRDMENLKRKQVMSQKEKYKRAAKGDIAYNMMRMWQGALGAAPVDGLVSPAYVVASPFPEANSAYYSYLFRTAAYMREVNKFSRGIVSDRNRLYWDEFKQMPSLLPPRAEQDQIVAYLRLQDAHISCFIKAKRELIGLVNEQKKMLIHQTVTHGLNSKVQMKSSGAAWFEQLPEHWEVRRIKSLSLVKRGASPRPIADPRYFDENGEYAWVRISDVTASRRYLEATTERLSELGKSYSVPLEPGAIFLSIAGSVGKPIITKIKCCIHDGFVYFPYFKGNRDYLYYIFASGSCYGGLGKLGTQLNLNTETVGSIRIPLPPSSEQNQIVEFLNFETGKFDIAIQSLESEIHLIREYRERLIADVVTGQIDVRDWVPGPDDVVADEDLAALADDDNENTEEDEPDGAD